MIDYEKIEMAERIKQLEAKNASLSGTLNSLVGIFIKLRTKMKIKDIIKKLNEIKKEHGNIEVTCTASFVGDNDDIFETTVENFAIKDKGIGECQFKRVRLLL